MYTSPLNAAVIILAGAATGILGAILGTGGGVFLIPLLVLGLGVPMHYAVATSIVSVIATSSAVASTNIERGTANMRLGMTLEIATSLGAMVGGVGAGWLAASVLEGFFGLALLPTAGLMWRGTDCEVTAANQTKPPKPSGLPTSPFDAAEASGALGGCYLDEGEGRVVTYRVRRLGMGWVVALVAGTVSGLLGIGGGVFKVPALHLLCGIPIKAAAATSNFMIGVTAAASAFVYYGRGEVRPALTAAAVIGVLVGSALGSALSRRVRGAQVRKVFAVLLVAVAVQMLYRAWFAG
jgi:uncharacterized membrane protein YfcA